MLGGGVCHSIRRPWLLPPEPNQPRNSIPRPEPLSPVLWCRQGAGAGVRLPEAPRALDQSTSHRPCGRRGRLRLGGKRSSASCRDPRRPRGESGPTRTPGSGGGLGGGCKEQAVATRGAGPTAPTVCGVPLTPLLLGGGGSVSVWGGSEAALGGLGVCAWGSWTVQRVLPCL